MKAKQFPEANVNLAESQDQYMTLPSFFGEVGTRPEELGIICCMELDDEEWQKVLVTRKVWCRFLTFGRPLQPFTLQFDRDIFGKEDDPNSYSVNEYHHNQDLKTVEVKPTFWQRVKMLFGYKLVMVFQIDTYGYTHSTSVMERTKFTWKGKDKVE